MKYIKTKNNIMSAEKNKQALLAMRAKYKEIFGEDPAANLGLPQLTKRIKDFEEDTAGVSAASVLAADAVSNEVVAPVVAALDPIIVESAVTPVIEAQAAAPDTAAPTVINPVVAADEESGEAPVSRKNQKPITAADMKSEKVMITNGRVTKPYTRFAWNNFLSKAPGKWRLVADVPPEVKSLSKD